MTVRANWKHPVRWSVFQSKGKLTVRMVSEARLDVFIYSAPYPSGEPYQTVEIKGLSPEELGRLATAIGKALEEHAKLEMAEVEAVEVEK